MLGSCWESCWDTTPTPGWASSIPLPDIAGQHLLLVLAEPGVPGLAALALPNEAIVVLVQGQEGCPCPLPLLGCQQPQKGILGGQRRKGGALILWEPPSLQAQSCRGLHPECHGQWCRPWESAPAARAMGSAVGVSFGCHDHGCCGCGCWPHVPLPWVLAMVASPGCCDHVCQPWEQALDATTIPAAVFSAAAGWTRGRGSPATRCAPSCRGPGR